ncbi:MAG: Histone deacetylase domain protein [Methanobacterium sp. PtaB.Bin024]|nr:MAG: Histone deacetylase domain protein [Methanobacterium sp. PtaB.Bin024]
MISLVNSPEYAKHQLETHPENQGRLEVLIDSLQNEGLLNKLDVHQPILPNEEDLLLVHTKEHLKHLKSFTDSGGGYLDYDTYASPHSYEIAKLAAGGAIKASELVLGQSDFAYSLARPPGHHATTDRAMGFCLINNLAVALKYMRKKHGIKKFLIFDFDAHYGNGTAEIFYHDPHVLYISIHQDPRTIFPGKGFIEEIGSGSGEGFNLNIPMPPGSRTSDYIYILKKILEPVCSQFKADFYYLDVGFDGHHEDPLSSLLLDDDFYPWAACYMQKITPTITLILEGGYSHRGMAQSNLKMIKVLMDKNLNEKEFQPHGKSIVKDETKKIFKEIQNTFSPFFIF